MHMTGMLSRLFNHSPERYEVSQFRTRRSWVRRHASYDEMREKTGTVKFEWKRAKERTNGIRFNFNSHSFTYFHL